MKMRLKLTLALLGVVASMVPLGVLGVDSLFDYRRAKTELQEVNGQLFLAQQGRGALDHLIVLARGAGGGTGPEDREGFRSHANELLGNLDALAAAVAEPGAHDRVTLLQGEISALMDEYDRARSGRPGETSEAIASIEFRVPRIRRHESQLATLLEDGLLGCIVTANRELQWSRFWLYACVLLAVILSVSFGYLLHRMILGPLSDLRDAIERIRTGELELALDVEGQDELAEVSRAFVEMSESLQRQFEEEEQLIRGLDEANERLEQERRDFEQLVEIGKATASTLKFIDVLGVLTTRAHLLISCFRCSIFQVDDAEPGTALLLSSTHYPSAGPTRILMAEYPEVGLAIERGQTVQVNDVATDPMMRDVVEATLGAGITSVLTVPMTHRGRFLGVIAFMRGADDPRGFTRWEKGVAESIGGIGAVCMENASLYGGVQRSRDDVEALNVTLRQTVEELRSTRDRLVASEKLAAVGEVSTSIAHSLKNPLAAIRAMAQAEFESGNPGENLQDIVTMVDRLTCHMNQILDFCRTGEEIRSAVDPNRTIEDAVGMLRTRADERRVAVVPRLASDLPRVTANPERFERAILSVIENALEACEPGEQVEIVTEREGASGIRIEVKDEGPGIPEEVLARMFEPFFSTKASGTGLGTTIARTVVESLAGTVDVNCGLEGGTCFVMRIPGASK